ncbi:MAG: YHS domain-containing protein [Euryarchaeota archaeon]|nr:YHS domain-containing protein [Euryarchaeota archaeon]
MMAIDPVCKMEVDEMAASSRLCMRARHITTVAPGCKKAFEENPEEYIGA